MTRSRIIDNDDGCGVIICRAWTVDGYSQPWKFHADITRDGWGDFRVQRGFGYDLFGVEIENQVQEAGLKMTDDNARLGEVNARTVSRPDLHPSFRGVACGPAKRTEKAQSGNFDSYHQFSTLGNSLPGRNEKPAVAAHFRTYMAAFGIDLTCAELLFDLCPTLCVVSYSIFYSRH